MSQGSVDAAAEALHACATSAWQRGHVDDAALAPLAEALRAGVSLPALVAHEKVRSVLVADEDKLRAQAANVLAKLLAVRGLALPVDACRHLSAFFGARLGDFPSVPGALDALVNVVRHHNTDASRTCVDVHDMFESVFSQLHVPALGQAIRQRVFTLMQAVLSHDNLVRALAERSEDFLGGAISCMEGERDPRCLIQCFKLVVAFYACFPAAIPMFAERIYDVTACYFPLSFVPPPNDPYGIKPEELSQSLEDALCGHESLLEFVVPFFIDKLSSTVVLAKQDSLKGLYRCVTKYDVDHFSAHMEALARELYLNATGGANSEITEMANKVITALGKHVHGDDWKIFASCILQPAAKEVCRNMDGIMARASMTSLVAMAKAGPEPFRSVLNAVMPTLLARLRDVHTTVQVELNRQTAAPAATSTVDGSLSSTPLQFILELLDCIDPAVDFKMHAKGPPMQPFAAELVLLLRAVLTDIVLHMGDVGSPLSAGATAQKTARIVELTIVCASKLLVQPPSPLVSESDSSSIVTSLCSMALAPALASSIQEAALSALVSLAQADEAFRKEVCAQIVEPQLAQLAEASAAQRHVSDAVVRALSKLLQDRAILEASVTAMCEALLETTAEGVEKLRLSEASVAILTILESALQNSAQERRVLELLAATSAAGGEQPSLVARLVRGLAVVATEKGQALSTTQLLGHVVQRTSAVIRAVIGAAYEDLHEQLATQVFEAADATNDQFSPDMLPIAVAAMSVLDKHSSLCANIGWLEQILAVVWPIALQRPDPANPASVQATKAAQQLVALVVNKASKEHLAPILDRVRADVIPQVFGAAPDASALAHYASLTVWVLKALAMRPDASTYSAELMQQVIQLLAGGSGGGSAQAADQLAYAMQDILPDDELVLTADGRCRISLLWKQRLFTQLFKPLFEAFQSHRTSSKMACLVVLCTVSGIVPKAVLSSDMESVSTAVIQAMAALSNPAGHEISEQQREALTSRALETLEVLLEHSQDTVALHLKTIIPVLLTAAQSAATARSRAAAIHCLLELTHLTYAVLHPYKQTVLNGLKAALDDKKKGVRRLAAKARNEWAVLGSVPV